MCLFLWLPSWRGEEYYEHKSLSGNLNMRLLFLVRSPDANRVVSAVSAVWLCKFPLSWCENISTELWIVSWNCGTCGGERRWRHLTDVMPSTQWLMYTFCILRVYSTYLPMGLYVSDVVMIAAIKIVFNVFMNATKPDLFTRYFLSSRRWLALYK